MVVGAGVVFAQQASEGGFGGVGGHADGVGDEFGLLVEQPRGVQLIQRLAKDADEIAVRAVGRPDECLDRCRLPLVVGLAAIFGQVVPLVAQRGLRVIATPFLTIPRNRRHPIRLLG